MEPHSTEIEVHIYPDLGQQLDSSAPLWIIVVSFLAGVSLVALICLLLWKLALECLGILPEELVEVAGERAVWTSLLRLLPPRPGSG